jgi:EmrB/QacA subfamily drug resistance transporter
MNSDQSSARIDSALLKLILVMVTGGMMGLLDATIVNVGIESLATHFNVSISSIEWVSTGYLLSVAMAIPIAGWALDRFGGKRIWIFALSVFLLGSLLSALAWSTESLIAFRVLQGIGGGMLEPIMLSVVVRAAGPARMTKVFGIMSLPISLGPVLGPILGGLILEDLSWKWLFLINMPIGLLALFLAFRILPKDPAPSSAPTRFDWLGMALIGPGFAAIIYALSQVGTNGFGADRVLIGLTSGAVLMALYALHAFRTSGTPIIDLRLFRSKSFSASVLVMFLVGGMLFSAMFLMPLFYQQIRDRGVLGAGLLLAPLGVGMMIGMPISSNLLDRVGARTLVPIGAIAFAASLFIFTQADAETSGLLLGAASVIAGMGIAFVAPSTLGSVYRAVPESAVTSATGSLFIFIQIGASFGVAVSALMLARRSENGVHTANTFNAAFWIVLAAAAVVTVASVLLPGRPKAGATPAPVGHGAMEATPAVAD